MSRPQSTEPPRASASALGSCEGGRDGAGEAAVVLAPAFVLLSFVALLPVLLTALPPLVDYLNHLARMHVIALAGRDPMLDRFYAVHWTIIPNLAEDLIVPPLARLTGVYLAGKLFVIAYMLLLLTGPHAIHYALYRRFSLGPLVAVLFLYNRINSQGWVNYLFGVGLALWAIAAWIALRPQRPLVRGTVSLLFVLALFFCHLAALGLYGVTIAAYETWHAWSLPTDRRRLAVDLAVLALPGTAALPLLLAGPVGDMLAAPPRWTVISKLRGPWYVISSGTPALDVAAALAMAGVVLWAVRRRLLRLHPAGWVFAAFAVVVYLATPHHMMSADGADLRLPIAMLFILIGFLEWRLVGPTRWWFLALLLSLTVFRVAAVEVQWARFDRLVADFRASLRQVAPGSKILVARLPSREPSWLGPLDFLPCLATIERSSLVSLTFSDPRQQILRVKPPYRAETGGYDDDAIPLAELLSPPHRTTSSTSGRIYWRHWPRTYDYLYLLDTHHDPDPSPRLDLLYDGDHLQLYRVKRRE